MPAAFRCFRTSLYPALSYVWAMLLAAKKHKEKGDLRLSLYALVIRTNGFYPELDRL